MKYVILIILIISCSFAPVFSKGSQEVLEQNPVIVTPNSIGDFEIGIDFEEVQEQLGKADSVFKDIYHFYFDLGLSFIVEGGTVIGITKFLDEGAAIIDGMEITNKMTLDEAQHFFNFDSTSGGSGDKLIFNNGNYHLEFYKEGNGVFYLKEVEIFTPIVALVSDEDVIDIELSDRDYVISIMGKPKRYIWGSETFHIDELPSHYIMDYENKNMACIYNGILSETRVHYPGNFTDFNGIRLGDTIEEVIDKIGKPSRIAEGIELNFEENVLFLNYSSSEIDNSSNTSYSYYSVPEKNVRIFFNNNKVNALYNTGGFTPEFLSAFSQYIKSR